MSDLEANRRTVGNVSLWDAAVLRPMLDDQESIGGYYRFPRLTVDRYDIDGEPRLLAVAARELDRSRLGPGARSWANDRFAYTHGYGAVAVSVGAVDRDGQARFVQREFASGPARAARAAHLLRPAARPRPPVRDRHERARRDRPTGSRLAGARLPLRRGGRHPALQPAAPARVRGALRRPQAAAHRDGHRPVAHHARSRRAGPRPYSGAVPALGRRPADDDRRRPRAVPAARLHHEHPLSVLGARAHGTDAGQLRARFGPGDGRRIQRPRAALRGRPRGPAPAGVGGRVPGSVPPGGTDARRSTRAPALSEAAVQTAGAGIRPTTTRTTPRRSGTAPTRGSCRSSWPGRSRTPARSSSPTRAGASSATSAGTTSPRRAGTCVPRTRSRACPAGRGSG